MVYFSIAMMIPIAALGSTILLHWLSGGYSKSIIPPDTFKRYILYYMITKTALSFVCAIMSFLSLDDNKALPQSEVLHEESRKLGFCTQIKLLVTDKVYFLFVYGPLVSISLIGATDNHLGSLLVAFSITKVSPRHIPL
jgi:hypothetical protein